MKGVLHDVSRCTGRQRQRGGASGPNAPCGKERAMIGWNPAWRSSWA